MFWPNIECVKIPQESTFNLLCCPTVVGARLIVVFANDLLMVGAVFEFEQTTMNQSADATFEESSGASPL